jgi:protein-S-isoprenylcysteine O-methyltransferase Ste14
LVLLGLLTRGRSGLAVPPGENAEGRPVVEALFDCLLAVSIASWALAGLSSTSPPIPPVRWAIGALHLAVALSLLRRSRVRKRSVWSTTALCLPAFVIAGFALSLGAPLDRWSLESQILFLGGTLLTVSAFAALGPSFAIFPAVRELVVSGPYRWIRHPAYAGEVLMIAACVLSRPDPLAVTVLGLALPLVALRIRTEEKLLLELEGYRSYAERVRARLVPGIW